LFDDAEQVLQKERFLPPFTNITNNSSLIMPTSVNDTLISSCNADMIPKENQAFVKGPLIMIEGTNYR
jgi:hypothetical protein